MLIALSAIVTTGAMAQNSFSYQSVIRNNGEVVSNQDVALLISILNGSDVCYQEVQKVKTNAYGNISVNVGEGEPKTGSFAAIPWETMQIMMQIEVSTDGTENYVNLGQMQIQPVPYTMYAASTTTVIQPKEATEDPIFEVRDSEGNLMFAVYETGVKVFVDQGSKAAKSKFAVAGVTANKGEKNLLTINADGTTVFVDDDNNENANTDANKAAKSRFAVASLESKGSGELLTIDGSGSTIYVDNDADGKAAKSKFAVAGHSAKGKKSGNNYTIDNNNSTLYVDFNNDASKAASQVLSIDGGSATFYIDADDDTKAAKSSFAVAGRSADKSTQTAFVVDGNGTVIYIDEWDNASKAAKSTFAVFGLSAQKGNNNFFIIHRDSTRIYVNDVPVVDTTGTEPGSAPVVAPSLASAFSVVGMTQKIDMLVVKKDCTIVRMNTYVEEEVQNSTGVVLKIIDDTKPDIIYTTGQIVATAMQPEADAPESFNITYAYYQSDKGEYLHLKYSDNGDYQYRNYYLIDNMLYADSIVASSAATSNLMLSAPEHYSLPMKNDTSLLMVYERTMRNNGYSSYLEDGQTAFYNSNDELVMTTEHNVLIEVDDTLNFTSNALRNILVQGLHFQDGALCEVGDLLGLKFSNGQLYDNTAAFDGCDEDVFGDEKEQSKLTTSQIEARLTALKRGFVVTAVANNPAFGSVQLSPAKERYTYGETLTLNPVIDKHIFTGWTDGCVDTVRTFYVLGDASYTAIFEEPVLFVSGANNANDENYGFSADKPLASIDGAIEKIKQTAMPGLDWTINIVGTLQGPQTIEGEETTEPVIYYYGQIYNVERTTHTLSTNSITIKGYGANATLLGLWDGENEPENSDKYSVLTISTNDSIIIENLTITGGYGSSGGGICANDTKLTIGKGCNITNNGAVHGGGIYISRGKLVVNGGSITYNKAETSAESFVDGGGIYACGVSDITINDGDISYNTGGDGGGICLNNDNNYEVYMINDTDYESTKSTVIINGGTISHNEATYCKFYNCAGGGSGGGIYVSQYATVIMTGGSITDNVATDNSYDEGGGICLYSASLIMTGGVISGNRASNGNGVYLDYASLAMGGGAKIDDETCLENTTITVASPLTSDIAAVITPLYNRYNDYYQRYTENEILIKPDTVSDEVFASAINKFVVTPKVSNGDTTMYYIGADAKLKPYTAVRFRNCVGVYAQYFMPGPGQTVKNPGTPQRYEYQYDGVTYNFKGWYVMNAEKEYVPFDFDTPVSDNDIEIIAFWDAEIVVPDKEGARSSIYDATSLMNDSYSDFTILVDGKLTGNQIIYNSYNINRVKSLNIAGKNGLNDKGLPKDTIDAGGDGIAFSINTSTPITISNLIITGGNNVSGNAYNSGKGGGLYIGSSANVTLDSVLVGDTVTTVANATTYANKAKNGGGVYVDGGTLTLKKGSVIGHNYATEHGGGIYVNSGGNLFIEPESKIVYNYGLDEAGGVWIEEGAMAEMTGGEISHNAALTFAGGIEIMGTFTMSGGTISYNEVTDFVDGQGYAGGGAFIGANGVFNMHGTASIICNKTRGCQGGAVKVAHETGTFRMTGGIIQGNTATECANGGGVRVESSNFLIGDSAYIASDNVVQLIEIDNNNPGHPYKVNIISQLTNENVATILPENYIADEQVLTAAEGVSLESNVDKFAITPQNGSIPWIITTTGFIIDFIEAESITTDNYGSVAKFTVTSAEGMDIISTLSVDHDFSGKIITLENDVTLNTSFTAIRNFKGTFNGNNHTISGLNGQVALFSQVNGDGTVKNLTVEGNSTIAGIVSSFTNGLIEGCTSRVNVTGTESCVGGIAGIMGNGSSPTIRNCVNEGTITSSNGYLGGIAGRENIAGSIIESCVNKGTVTYTGNSYVFIGGICGDSFGIIRNCINAAKVNGGSASSVGGITGTTHCPDGYGNGIINCANIGTVSGSYRVGGIAGDCDISGSLRYDANVFNCYNAGVVTATETNGSRGAVVGEILTGGSGTCTLTHNYYKSGTASAGVYGKTDSESNSTATVPSTSVMDTWVNNNNSESVYKTWTTKDGNPVPNVGYDW